MPELDLGSVIGPQGPKGDKGIDGAVGPVGPQGEKGDDGAAATINGVNAMTMTTGDGLEATMTGSAYNLKLTDKALNAIQTVPTLVRPNFLDNWYFGNPVDQRKGYIVPAGVAYYKVEGYVPQGPIPETVRVDYIDYAGSARFNYGGVPCYVPKDGGYVRGYLPAWDGYSIDRWSVEADSNAVITLINEGIHVKNTSSNIVQFKQILPSDLNLAGRMITISVLVGDIIGPVNYILTQTNSPYQTSAECRLSSNGLFSASGRTLTEQQKIVFVLDPGAEITILATKLELGTTQTLAHQEEGQWVLNEIPAYGEQVRRCQRYYQVHPAIYWLPQNADGTNRLTIPIPDMRTIPVVTYEPADGSTGTLYYDANLAQKDSIQFYATGATGICGVKNIRLSADL